jgi:hypothetical protein
MFEAVSGRPEKEHGRRKQGVSLRGWVLSGEADRMEDENTTLI